MNIYSLLSLTLNVKPLAQTWIKYEFHRSDGRIGLMALQTYSIDKHPIELKDDGLFTKEFLLSIPAHAYARIAAVVFKTEPLNFIGSGKPVNKKSPQQDFELSGDLKNLPQSEIDTLEPIIQKYADQAVVNALDDANLILSE